jgi:hypothetical protein
MSDKLQGPWSGMKTVLSTLPSNDPLAVRGAKMSYNSQHDFVLPIHGNKGTMYLYCGDRYSQFTKEGIGKNVWLPLKFDGDTPTRDWYPSWYLDAAQGTWSAEKKEK